MQIVLGFLLLVPGHASVSAGELGAQVRIRSGPITGEQREGVRVFRGVPYAAPPVGDLRWRAPVPPQPWTQPRAMVEFAPGCPQKPDELFGGPKETSEDCLYLNVWTAAQGDDEKRPVMMWIHGGGFVQGAGSLPSYGGLRLAQLGVVVVTINYRLGPLGFVAHPALTAESPNHTSGNYGLLDQILALKWVQENAAAFGGDPGNVTIFGESAGAVSVCTLMASPLARGLFHRAIAQSGAAPPRLRYRDRDDDRLKSAESAGVELSRRLGVSDGPEALLALRALPSEALLDAANLSVGIPGATTQQTLCIDGYVLTEAPGAAFAAGRQADVPFIAGTCADEGTIFTPRIPILTVRQFRGALTLVWGRNVQQALALYPVNSDTEVPKALATFLGDGFLCETRTACRNMVAIQPSTYRYQFSRIHPALATMGLGCFHGSEIPYVFGVPPKWGFSPQDTRLSEQVMGYWTRFARTGDPNGEGVPEWPRYAADTDPYLVLDTQITVGHQLRRQACDLRAAARGG